MDIADRVENLPEFFKSVSLSILFVILILQLDRLEAVWDDLASKKVFFVVWSGGKFWPPEGLRHGLTWRTENLSLSDRPNFALFFFFKPEYFSSCNACNPD